MMFDIFYFEMKGKNDFFFTLVNMRKKCKLLWPCHTLSLTTKRARNRSPSNQSTAKRRKRRLSCQRSNTAGIFTFNFFYKDLCNLVFRESVPPLVMLLSEEEKQKRRSERVTAMLLPRVSFVFCPLGFFNTCISRWMVCLHLVIWRLWGTSSKRNFKCIEKFDTHIKFHHWLFTSKGSPFVLFYVVEYKWINIWYLYYTQSTYLNKFIHKYRNWKMMRLKWKILLQLSLEVSFKKNTLLPMIRYTQHKFVLLFPLFS